MKIGKIHKCFAVVVALFLLVTLTACRPSNSSINKNTDTLKSGESGNCEWELDMTSGQLTISGDGYMKSELFRGGVDQPWIEWKADIKTISLEGEIKEIPSEAFSACVNLESVNIPSSVRKIDYRAFYCCTSLKEIVVPDGVEKIDKEAFALCTSLSSVRVSDNLKSVGERAFNSTLYEKNNMTGGALYVGKCLAKVSDSVEGEYLIKAGTLSISEEAFKGCGNLTEVFVPDSVTYIAEGAFMNCTSLKKATLPDGLEKLESNAFNGCSSLEDVNIPASLNTIQLSTFSGCGSLSSIDIHSNIKTIEAYAFKDCSLSEVTVGKDCDVDSDAFDKGVTVTKE